MQAVKAVALLAAGFPTHSGKTETDRGRQDSGSSRLLFVFIDVATSRPVTVSVTVDRHELDE